jgi:hypothetical protein
MIDPDDKDWTWVLEGSCPECGFDASSMHGGPRSGAVAERYEEQDPAIVVGSLVAAAGTLARLLEGFSASEWERRGRRSDGASFTVDSISRYMIHDPIHRVWDVSA